MFVPLAPAAQNPAWASAAIPEEGVWRMLEAIARIAPRSPMVPNKISLYPSCFFGLYSFFSRRFK
jgi:hypothetical protein